MFSLHRLKGVETRRFGQLNSTVLCSTTKIFCWQRISAESAELVNVCSTCTYRPTVSPRVKREFISATVRRRVTPAPATM
jgi:DNA-directed RNA polymerase subunit RPC12/RpoP